MKTQKVQLLDAGADDYLIKPFSLAELLARMRVALRHRGKLIRPATLRYEHAGVAVDLQAHHVHRDGTEVHLTPTEYRLLARLVRNAGQVVTHRQLLHDVWGPEFTEHTHYLRLYMGQLRAKLEDRTRRSAAAAHRAGRGLPAGGSGSFSVRCLASGAWVSALKSSVLMRS